MRTETARVAELLRSAQTIAIGSHLNPDGDCIGSALALRLALLTLGKQVDCYDHHPVPQNLRELPGADSYHSAADLPGKHYDLVLTVDVASVEQLGDCQALLTLGDTTALIDHHGTNAGYAAVNLVDGSASAAGLLVREVIAALGVELTCDMATCLYVAISTDTGNFRFDNTTPEAFAVAAELRETGFDLPHWSGKLFAERPLAQTRLIGRALSRLQMRADNRLAVMMLTEQDFIDCGALPEHTDTIVNYGTDIQGACMALLARTTERGVKCSLRSVPGYRVDAVARLWNGGGHAEAAGCTVTGKTLEEAAAAVADAMEKALLEQTK